MTGALEKPRPRPTRVTAPFWDALAQDRVVLQHCDDCGAWVHYPRARCPRCLSARLSWHEVTGDATVYTFTVAYQATAPQFADEVPQVLAVVELTEGVRMTTTLVDVAPEAVEIGMAVGPAFDHGPDGITLLRYRPA